jgi:glutamate synthase (NADPH/NADH) large chain
MHYTQSPVAKKILDNLKEETKKFVKVMPLEYKRILQEQKVAKKLQLTEVSDG